MNKIFGYEKEKAQIEQIKGFIKNIDRYREIGVRIPRGLLLYGEPGVGKTSLAMSLVEDGVNMICIKSNSEMSLKKQVSNAFGTAKESSPSIIFIDEIDKIAGTSRAYFMEGNDNVRKTLLREMDALSDNDGVMVVATCNDVDCMGEALTRSGRFDRIIHVGLPTDSDRKEILENYFGRISLKKNFDMAKIVKYTLGYTGADLECIVNESGIMAVSENKDEITEEDINKVMNRMAFESDEKDLMQDETELYKIAVHEAGHALVALMEMPNSVISATIRPQGGSMGHLQCVDDENCMPSVNMIKKKIAIALGGRIAEREILSDIFLGSSSDLRHAYAKAGSLITMHAAFGYELANPIPPNASQPSPETLFRIEEKIADVLSSEDKRVTNMIIENKATLLKIAEELMEKTVLTREELLACFPCKNVKAA